MKFKILTIFPELFPGVLSHSVTGIALEKKLWSLQAIDIRKYAKDKRGTVDDTPYGGGSGMVLKADVIADAIEDNLTKSTKIIYLSPRGKIFNQEMSYNFSKEKEIMILCGRYEGVDQRVIDEFSIEEISIGDYILSGGEIACFAFVDAILRNIEGVLGQKESLLEESFGSQENKTLENLLEYPHFTKPSQWRNRKVPQELISGNHKKIQEWRIQQSIELTKKTRPDLYQKFLNKNDKS